ncbi:type I restriction endonuclease subunit R [Leptospira selangorensis]|uniref:type I restriction endonuclease subunit R n=1 Tax=Leptospira selangorensis TaxID=2484982 RepID=UPI0010845931|nr:type I restriction endonuclease subunit R [Leptospira selangorensis]TGK06095.1 type I restriction endonuclease subunit R [Leptospira selangorensis]
MNHFPEERLEAAIIALLAEQGYPHSKGESLDRSLESVLIISDLKEFLIDRYSEQKVSESELDSIIRKLEAVSTADLYESNKTLHTWITSGFALKRESQEEQDFHLDLIDFENPEKNRFRVVNQLEILGSERRIPDAILYINGLPLIVFEFKSAIRENAGLDDAFKQLTIRYTRGIPELMKYNMLCVISNGVDSRIGSMFAPYEFFYTWRKITGNESVEASGFDSLHSMVQGLFQKERLLDVLHHFVYFPDTSHKQEKIVCRYPQYYAARKLYKNILKHIKPKGDGKGGTYFGATGCGKSFTMLFLTRLLMKEVELESPTIILITDRTDLDDQLSQQFTAAKKYIGDNHVLSVETRSGLQQLLQGRSSGGVFLTTIQKFTEATELLSDRTNIICISDEAHRSQINLDQKIKIGPDGIKRTYGFAKYLHDSLPNATYVGFTGTPIDSTLDVFGEIVDSYTMTESVKDKITVPIVYEGRAAKVVLDNSKLKDIEDYYAQCAEEGSSEYQIEESKKASANMSVILGDPDRLRALASDFVEYYERRMEEKSSIKGKAIFVSSKREIAYEFWKEVVLLRPQWNESLPCEPGLEIAEEEKKKIKPLERIKMVMTRGKDDPKILYDLLGSKEYRKDLDQQFKNPKSNFKIAIVVDMWLTGFDVPELDTIYIDKPVQRHNLIQTISRVNRKFEGKKKGLVVDYIGIKSQLNLALALYNKADQENIEEIRQSIVIVRDQLDLLQRIFHSFDTSAYFNGTPLQQLECLNRSAEFVQTFDKLEKRFIEIVKRLKAAYDICSASEILTGQERDTVHFYLAVRSIIYKLTKGPAPDTSQMNAKVRKLIEEALKSDGVEEIFKLGEGSASVIELFDDKYLAKIEKIKLPNTKIKLLLQLLARGIEEFKKINKVTGIDFTKRFEVLVHRYNERKEEDVLVSTVLEDFTIEILDLMHALRSEQNSGFELGFNIEQKSFYDILKSLTLKYDFVYPDEKLIPLAKAVKELVDDKSKYIDWNKRGDIKAELKADLIVLLGDHGYPPVDHDEVYKEIYEQAENFKRNR